jgi:hypothetical protein
VDGQTYLNVQFVERTDTIDLTYVIQLSSDLLTWSPAAPLTQLSATPNADGVTQTVAFQVGPSISSGSAALFTRISVTVP